MLGALQTITRMPESGFRNQSVDACHKKGFTEPSCIARAHYSKSPQNSRINISSLYDYFLSEQIRSMP